MTETWAFMQRKTLGIPGDPMLTRYILFRTPWGGLYAHRIFRSDHDRELHDHPWWFASFILSGGYTEMVGGARPGRSGIHATERIWRRFTMHRMPLSSAHYITAVRGRLVTLVVVGPRRQEWGFWTAGGFVPWQQYTRPGEGWHGPDPFDS